MKNNVGIIGYGWVGKATAKLFENTVVCDPSKFEHLSIDELNDTCDVHFVCVPTPLKDGKLDLDIGNNIIELLEINLND